MRILDRFRRRSTQADPGPIQDPLDDAFDALEREVLQRTCDHAPPPSSPGYGVSAEEAVYNLMAVFGGRCSRCGAQLPPEEP